MKPSLFKNELLATSDALYTWVFEGLWCLADRAGRLEDRPRRIHLEVNAGRAFEGTEQALSWLCENGFIRRYEAGGQKYIQVEKFGKHQTPHHREPESSIPAPDVPEASPRQAQGEPESSRSLSSFPLPESPFLNPEEEGTRASRSPTAPAGEAERKKRGIRIPTPFVLTAHMRAWAKSETPDVDVDFETKEFVDYWRTVPGQKGCKLDWELTWQVRMREMQRRAKTQTRRFNGDDTGWRPTS